MRLFSKESCGNAASGNLDRIPISKIEDLSDAVFDAGLEATQMSAGHLSGGLAFSESGVLCSSGLLNGRIALFGPLSQDMITLGVGLRLEAGTRHWLNDVQTGNVGVFLPGDEHDSIYTSGSMYAAITLTSDKLEEEAAKENLVLDRTILGSTGIHARTLAPTALAQLQQSFQDVHDKGTSSGNKNMGMQMLSALIPHLARAPHQMNGGAHPRYHGKIVQRARSYIHPR